MYRHKNHRSKTKTRSKTALALLLWCVAAGMWIARPVRGLTPESKPVALSRISPFEITGTVTPPPPPTKSGGVRRIYGHSLVAGGIHSVDELMAAIKRDRQLAEHYKNFDLSKAHIVMMDHDVTAYVSYRLAQGIYWQARPSIIAKGEQVITDGTNFIRARCGNRISYAQGFPTSPSEPEDLDIVVTVRSVDPPPVGPADLLTPPIADSPLPGSALTRQRSPGPGSATSG